MGKICNWYRDNSCDCFCDGLDANCENYCGDLLSDKDKEEIKKETENTLLISPKLNDVFPINIGKEEMRYNNCHKWYKVCSFEHITMLEETYISTFNNLRDAFATTKEPQIVCISYHEEFEENNWVDDAECYLLSDMKKDTISFWEKFGFDIEFKKKGE